MSVTTTVRMYNQLNLGDCFLLKFSTADEESFLLIDFGSYEGNNQEREKEIAEDIRKTVGDKKLTIVLTHQHKDHYSGFLHAGEALEGTNRELWLSYLDSEKSKEGQLIRSVTEKYWNKTKKTKELIKAQFIGTPGNDKGNQVADMLEHKKSYDLFAEEQSGGAAITRLLDIAGHHVRFLTPGECFFMPGTGDGIKVYVLGPPYNDQFLTKTNPKEGEEVRGLTAMMELANMDLSGTMMLDALITLQDSSYCKDDDFPFSKQYINDDPADPIKKAYSEPGQEWRNIDTEWLSEVGRLSLYMDKLTNNTSLVLAFEIVASKKVMLFVGDAQIGNWQSWSTVKFKDSEVTTEDLLSRTVLYKAGHHSSVNATLKQSLELMNEKELIIMIPVNQRISEKYGFHMLKPGMMSGYHRKSQGRVLRSDSIIQDGSSLVVDPPFFNQARFGAQLKVFPEGNQPHLWLEVAIK
jgi:hypothetical protein